MDKILIASESFIISKGISAIIKEINSLVNIRIALTKDQLIKAIKEFEPQIIISSEEFETVVSKLNVKILIISEKKQSENISIYSEKQKITTVLKEVLTQKSIQTTLTEREKEIVKLVALGLTNKEIAEKLFISPHTVITHRKNITEKLGIKTISGLTLYALLNGLIDAEEINLR